jgi:hypothetical protein
LSPWHGGLFGWKCPEFPAEFGPPKADAGPTAIRAIAAVRAATFRIRLFISSPPERIRAFPGLREETAQRNHPVLTGPEPATLRSDKETSEPRSGLERVARIFSLVAEVCPC